MEAFNKYGGTGAPVVEGTPLVDGNTSSFTRGEKQAVSCRDPFFAVLFYIQLAVMMVLASVYGPVAVTDSMASIQNSSSGSSSSSSSSGSSGTASNGGLLAYVLSATAVVSVILSAATLTLMIRMPDKIVEMALMFSTVLSGLWMVLAFLSGNLFAALFGMIFFAISVCYMRAVWSRIPYAASNLLTATTAVKHNAGLLVQAYFFSLLAVVWTTIWGLSAVGIYYSTTSCHNSASTGKTVCTSSAGGVVYTLLILSFYFTHQVLHNTVHVIVSGVVGEYLSRVCVYPFPLESSKKRSFSLFLLSASLFTHSLTHCDHLFDRPFHLIRHLVVCPECCAGMLFFCHWRQYHSVSSRTTREEPLPFSTDNRVTSTSPFPCLLGDFVHSTI